ncbi:hypothetical protein [Streptomyces sasae]|uniref:hypothetical protein n=1 Tax=Streptomyces sasae TaxID=1266772 RepID=UPI00292FCBE4|nr:hypothetical protein [Streptomyces sasae]
MRRAWTAPLIWTRQDGCHFCASEEELEAWERAWISEKLTQFRRMITGTLAPCLALFLGSRWAKYLNTQITAVESSLEMVASQTG